MSQHIKGPDQPPVAPAPLPLAVDDCWNRIGIWSSVDDRCPKLDELFHCRNCPVFSENARRILDRPVDERYRQDWQQLLDDTRQQQALRGKLSLFTFRIGDQWLGVQTRLVAEVAAMTRFHSIPHARDEILRGLVNIRGELRVCVSLGRLLGITRSASHAGMPRVVVLRNKGHQFAFPVNEARGALNYADSELRDPPHALAAVSETLVRGVLERDQLKIACLDETLLLTTLAERLK